MLKLIPEFEIYLCATNRLALLLLRSPNIFCRVSFLEFATFIEQINSKNRLWYWYSLYRKEDKMLPKYRRYLACLLLGFLYFMGLQSLTQLLCGLRILGVEVPGKRSDGIAALTWEAEIILCLLFSSNTITWPITVENETKWE